MTAGCVELRHLGVLSIRYPGPIRVYCPMSDRSGADGFVKKLDFRCGDLLSEQNVSYSRAQWEEPLRFATYRIPVFFVLYGY